MLKLDGEPLRGVTTCFPSTSVSLRLNRVVLLLSDSNKTIKTTSDEVA